MESDCAAVQRSAYNISKQPLVHANSPSEQPQDQNINASLTTRTSTHAFASNNVMFHTCTSVLHDAKSMYLCCTAQHTTALLKHYRSSDGWATHPSSGVASSRPHRTLGTTPGGYWQCISTFAAQLMSWCSFVTESPSLPSVLSCRRQGTSHMAGGSHFQQQRWLACPRGVWALTRV